MIYEDFNDMELVRRAFDMLEKCSACLSDYFENDETKEHDADERDVRVFGQRVL